MVSIEIVVSAICIARYFCFDIQWRTQDFSMGGFSDVTS